MNYEKHYYNLLIERAKNRDIPEIYEEHHIFPKCLDGSAGNFKWKYIK